LQVGAQRSSSLPACQAKLFAAQSNSPPDTQPKSIGALLRFVSVAPVVFIHVGTRQ
jgi:hypothetical protein